MTKGKKVRRSVVFWVLRMLTASWPPSPLLRKLSCPSAWFLWGDVLLLLLQFLFLLGPLTHSPVSGEALPQGALFTTGKSYPQGRLWSIAIS